MITTNEERIKCRMRELWIAYNESIMKDTSLRRFQMLECNILYYFTFLLENIPFEPLLFFRLMEWNIESMKKFDDVWKKVYKQLRDLFCGGKDPYIGGLFKIRDLSYNYLLRMNQLIREKKIGHLAMEEAKVLTIKAMEYHQKLFDSQYLEKRMAWNPKEIKNTQKSDYIVRRWFVASALCYLFCFIYDSDIEVPMDEIGEYIRPIEWNIVFSEFKVVSHNLKIMPTLPPANKSKHERWQIFRKFQKSQPKKKNGGIHITDMTMPHQT